MNSDKDNEDLEAMLARWHAEEGAVRRRQTGADGKLYAHASTTCFVFDVPS